ncbi:ComEA family DNA-binding protein [Methylobacterium organophilum]|uniref:Helix-hairpin-helix domain-containing protein n=1 Tax=Methylobacterium organophilum TaxID=410 RepID=A0ABQ4TAI0_METOR|nr:helix-hairpin-helix domain-containing protein [Methylobacterium organophilum]GJE27351.1 hypothetical protein LKMONMHP_2209 [Methylobacterium organophilum]
MKASTLFLGFTLAVLAAVLTLLWQAFGPRPLPPSALQGPATKPAPTAPAPAERTEEPGVRSVYPGPRPSAAPRPGSSAEAPAAPAPAPAPLPEAGTEKPAPAAPARGAEAAPPDEMPGEDPQDVPAAPAPAEAAGGETGGVDLNTASVEQLNGLGAGMIGRVIVAGRPYASPDDLVTRRILTRRDFETIRPHVTVR